MIILKTNLGTIELELFYDKAPITTKNFVDYVKSGFYDGTIFHRVIKHFVIQGGGLTPALVQKRTNAPIQNEADNGLSNDIGTIAMARTSNPHSAPAQFFINTDNNTFLNFRSKDLDGWGYCVFGKVVSGMDVIAKIESVPTGRGDIPVETILIEKATCTDK